MVNNPPEGSRIELKRDIHSTSYIWKNPGKGLGFRNAFLFFWLCGWTIGGLMALIHIFGGSFEKEEDRWFMLAWLTFWAVGEVVVISILYFALRPQKPSVLTLSPGSIHFETGTRPLGSFNADYETSHPLAFFEKYKNKIYVLETSQINNLKLERAGERQRLTFDYGRERIEIGDSLSEPEREWLFDILREHK